MKLHHIYISQGHNFFGRHGQPAGSDPAVEVERVEAVAGQGLQGDRFFGWKEDYKGQVTFFSMETYENLCRQLGVTNRPPSVFRRNLLVSGVDLMSLVGKEFELQGVRFLGTQESAPCYWMNQAFAEGAEVAMKGQGGLRAKVLSTGWLQRES